MKRYIIIIVLSVILVLSLSLYALGKGQVNTIDTEDSQQYDACYIEGYNQGCLDTSGSFLESYGVRFDGDWRWGVDDEYLLSIEECIGRSKFAANSHASLAYKYKEDIDHNIYWMNVHNSCAYWLEELGIK